MMRLQGMNPDLFNQVVSDPILCAQIGNSMSVNVLDRIFARVLPAANLTGPVDDPWLNGQGRNELCHSFKRRRLE